MVVAAFREFEEGDVLSADCVVADATGMPMNVADSLFAHTVSIS